MENKIKTIGVVGHGASISAKHILDESELKCIPVMFTDSDKAKMAEQLLIHVEQILICNNGEIKTNVPGLELTENQKEQILGTMQRETIKFEALPICEVMQPEIIIPPKSNDQPWKKRKKGCSGYRGFYSK